MTTTTTMTRPLPPVLADLRIACVFAGIRAESPDHLDPEGERMAREERQS